MNLWRMIADRLCRGNKSHAGTCRRIISASMALFLLVTVLTGCAGAARHESWPGLLVTDDTIYAANLERVQAFNAETGKLLWSFPEELKKGQGPYYSTPLLADDYGDYGLLLVAGYNDKTVYALPLGESPAERPDDPVWTFTQATGQYVGSGVVADGKFIIGNGDGYVYAIDLDDGALAWEFPTKDRVWATPVVIEDTVYIASLDHNLYAVDVATGTERWHVQTGGAISATPVYIDGALWVGDFSSTLYQIDLATEQIAWTTTANDWLWASPIADGTKLYFADVGGYVYALNTETHEMLWSAPAEIDDIIHGRPALNTDGSLLYVAGYKRGIIHAIDTNTGLVMNWWGEKESAPGRLPGDLTADEVYLYAMPILVDQRIRAFELATREIAWTYPSIESDK
jgi:outer membrane protein assembly factor BamB